MNVSFELSQEDVDRFASEFVVIAEKSAEDALRIMGDVAVQFLHDRDAELEHNALAEMWYRTEPETDGDSVFVDVLSSAEDATFYNSGWTKDGIRTHRDPRYPVSGRMLLAILEAGAEAHFIFPKDAKRIAIPVPGLAERTTEFHKKYGFAYNHPAPEEDVWYTDSVMHPGVMANLNVENAAALIENGLDQYGEEIAEMIQVELR